jgi:hypothetical protein
VNVALGPITPTTLVSIKENMINKKIGKYINNKIKAT